MLVDGSPGDARGFDRRHVPHVTRFARAVAVWVESRGIMVAPRGRDWLRSANGAKI